MHILNLAFGQSTLKQNNLQQSDKQLFAQGHLELAQLASKIIQIPWSLLCIYASEQQRLHSTCLAQVGKLCGVPL